MFKLKNKIQSKTWHSVWKSQKSPYPAMLWGIIVIVKTGKGVCGREYSENSLSVVWGVIC